MICTPFSYGDFIMYHFHQSVEQLVMGHTTKYSTYTSSRQSSVLLTENGTDMSELEWRDGCPSIINPIVSEETTKTGYRLESLFYVLQCFINTVGCVTGKPLSANEKNLCHLSLEVLFWNNSKECRGDGHAKFSWKMFICMEMLSDMCCMS